MTCHYGFRIIVGRTAVLGGRNKKSDVGAKLKDIEASLHVAGCKLNVKRKKRRCTFRADRQVHMTCFDVFNDLNKG